MMKGVGNIGSEGRVGAAGSSVEDLGNAVVGNEVVGNEGCGFGADAVRSSGGVFARGRDEKVIALVVDADHGLGVKRGGSQGIEDSLGLGLHGNIKSAHGWSIALVSLGCKADAIWEENWNCQRWLKSRRSRSDCLELENAFGSPIGRWDFRRFLLVAGFSERLWNGGIGNGAEGRDLYGAGEWLC